MTETLMEEEKPTNKETVKQEETDSLIHNTTKSYPAFVQNFKIPGAVLPEISLTQGFLCTRSVPKVRGLPSKLSFLLSDYHKIP